MVSIVVRVSSLWFLINSKSSLGEAQRNPGFAALHSGYIITKPFYLMSEFYPVNSSVGILNNRKAPDITLANRGAATAAA